MDNFHIINCQLSIINYQLKKMPAYWLSDYEISFPHPTLAESDGLVAIGGDLRPERLILAYRNGIFPWFEEDGIFAWYSPDPRCVLVPSELKLHKSMKSTFNQKKFEYTLDTCFEKVITSCAAINRKEQMGSSWISDNYIASYTKLHQLGIAHSVEVWENDELVGGLYGLGIGKVFCGESMFASVPNASKAGFITLVKALNEAKYTLIDCQQETEHLKSMGAKTISRLDFLDKLAINQHEKSMVGSWSFDEENRLVCSPLKS
jgi:leucyl/phenylalanyl-tRNA---protein transferase